MTAGREPENTTAAPPYDGDAEGALLGAALLRADAAETLSRQTRPSDFYVPQHRAIAEAISKIWLAGIELDPISVASELPRDTATAADLVALQASCANPRNAKRYASIVHDHATRRRLLEVGERFAGLAELDAHEAVVKAAQLVEGVAQNNGSRAFSGLIQVDVAELLAGTLELENPDFLTRQDGHALLYSGKMHVFQSEPSSGKTWLALAASKEILELGGSVIYADYEDTPKGIIGRLLAVGATPEAVGERFRYVSFEGPFGATERLELDRLLAELNPDLVVIDGVAEAIARDGYDEDKNRDVVEWTERLPRPIARTGAAVLMLDHVTKDREKRGRTARGAGHKLASVDGAAYEIVTTTHFSRSTEGAFRLKIAKDRPGGVGPIGEDAAHVRIEPHADGARVVLTVDPPSSVMVPRARKPTIVMGMISEALSSSKVPVSASTLRNLVNSKPKLVDSALAHLKSEGFVIDERRGRSMFLKLVKPYAPDADSPDAPPPDESLFDDEIGEF